MSEKLQIKHIYLPSWKFLEKIHDNFRKNFLKSSQRESTCNLIIQNLGRNKIFHDKTKNKYHKVESEKNPMSRC